MSSGNFPVWHLSLEADRLRKAIAIIEEVIDWGYEHFDDSGSGQFDNDVGDITDLQNLRQAVLLIKGEIGLSPEEEAAREEETRSAQELRKQLVRVTFERDALLRFMDSTIRGVAMFQEITGFAERRSPRESGQG